MNFSMIFGQMAVLFLVILVGFVSFKTKVLTPESNKLLSRLTVHIAMPCTVLSSVLRGEVTASGGDAAVFMLLALAAFALMFLIAAPAAPLLRVPKADAGLIRFMIVFGNVGFMGFPVIEMIFGAGAVFYVTIINIFFRILAFSVGILMVAGRQRKMSLGFFINPTLLTSLAAVFLFYAKIPVAPIISQTVSLVGQLTTPAAMLLIGSTLAALPMREVFAEKRLYPVAAARLLVAPLLVWLIFGLFVPDKTMLGVLVTLSAMPTAATATMIALEYGGNVPLATKGVFLSTLLSVITLPLLLYLLF